MLPQNILTWMVVTILCAVICILYRRRMLVITPFFFCLVIGAILLTAPLLWKTQPFYLWGALPRIIGLWGGRLFLFLSAAVAPNDYGFPGYTVVCHTVCAR